MTSPGSLRPDSDPYHTADLVGVRFDVAEFAGAAGDGGFHLGNAPAHAVEIQIDDRRGEQRERLADNEPADDAEAERLAEFGAGAESESQRQRAEIGRAHV